MKKSLNREDILPFLCFWFKFSGFNSFYFSIKDEDLLVINHGPVASVEDADEGLNFLIIVSLHDIFQLSKRFIELVAIILLANEFGCFAFVKSEVFQDLIELHLIINGSW